MDFVSIPVGIALVLLFECEHMGCLQMAPGQLLARLVLGLARREAVGVSSLALGSSRCCFLTRQVRYGFRNSLRNFSDTRLVKYSLRRLMICGGGGDILPRLLF